MLYLNNIKPRTVKIYENDIRLHIKPALGAIRLESLKTHTIQKFYNELTHGTKGKHPHSPKTVKNIHGVLHHALNQAVANEMLRLTRDCVDFEKGILLIKKQIQLHQEKELKGAYTLTSPKNGKSRTIAAAPFVMKCLKRQKVKQTEWRLKAGEVWGNPDGLVFTDEIGGHLTNPQSTVNIRPWSNVLAVQMPGSMI